MKHLIAPRPALVAVGVIALAAAIIAVVDPSLALPLSIGLTLFVAFWAVTIASTRPDPRLGEKQLLARGILGFVIRIGLAFAVLAVVGAKLGDRELVAAMSVFAGCYFSHLVSVFAVAIRDNRQGRFGAAR